MADWCSHLGQMRYGGLLFARINFSFIMFALLNYATYVEILVNDLRRWIILTVGMRVCDKVVVAI